MFKKAPSAMVEPKMPRAGVPRGKSVLTEQLAKAKAIRSRQPKAPAPGPQEELEQEPGY